MPAVAEERERVAAVWRTWVPETLAAQCRDGSGDDGGFAQDASGWYCGRHAAYTLARLMAARLWSRELGLDAGVIDAACVRTLGFLMRRQASDGSLDLGGLYSSNEVGFPLTGLALAWRRYEAAGISPTPGYLGDLLAFCIRGGEALLTGSAFTANHRWAAVAAPLACLNLIRPDRRYERLIESLLAQGVDVNADGCWEHERSPNYNNVAGQGMLVLADTLGREDLLKPLLAHGEFALHSLQPNGEMDSTISHRQDRAQPGCVSLSYGFARRLALITGDGRFSAMARHAWREQPGPEGELVPLLLQLDAHPGPLPAERAVPDRYEVVFAQTGQVRIRTPRTAVGFAWDRGGHFFDTVRDRWGGAKRSDDWFHLHHGGVVIESFVLAGAGMLNMQPSDLRRIGPGRYELFADQPGWEHTLHFMPGSPRTEVVWGWRSRIEAQVDADAVSLEVESSAARSLVAALHMHVRPGVRCIQGNGDPRILRAGERLNLGGGGPLRLEAEDGSAITVSGLPAAAHRSSVFFPSGVPSSIAASCATLSLGLLFPVSLKLRMELSL